MENTSFPPSVDVEYLQGIHVIDSILWLDTVRKTDLCFLSHAATDSIKTHGKVLLTKTTAILLQHGKNKSRMLICPYQQRFSLGELDLEIFPSGYMPGSAQIRITKGRDRLVYTGPFRLENPYAKQDIPVLDCDILVIRAEYGYEEDRPGDKSNEDKILNWTNQQLNAGLRPVIYTESLAQNLQVIHLFAKQGMEVSVPASIYRLFRKIGSLKGKPCGIRRLGNKSKSLCPITMPMNKRHTKGLSRLGCISTARLSGLPDSHPDHSACETEASFFIPPMTASFHEQLHYVHESKAGKIYVTGPAAEAFAATLRGLDFNAWPLRPPEQLNLFAPTTTRYSKPNEWFP